MDSYLELAWKKNGHKFPADMKEKYQGTDRLITSILMIGIVNSQPFSARLQQLFDEKVLFDINTMSGRFFIQHKHQAKVIEYFGTLWEKRLKKGSFA